MYLKQALEMITREELQRSAVICDALDDTHPVVFVSDAFETHTGFARDEVIGKNLRMLQGPDTTEDSKAAFAQAIRDEVPLTVDIVNYRKDGTSFLNHVKMKPIRNAAGKVTHFSAVQSIRSPGD